MLRKIRIVGMRYCLPSKVLHFGNQTRYRLSTGETQLTLATNAIEKVLECTNTKISDIDLIVSACAVPYQLIPNMASLIYEKFNDYRGIPCIDINTTCTSFISTLDIVSYMIDAKRYKKVLIVSSDVPSKAINDKNKETYELFSDCAVATIVEACDEEVGILYSCQKTFPHGAHDTEIIGGAAGLTVHELEKSNIDNYFFHMNGINAIRLTLSNLKNIYKDILDNVEKIDYMIPHQASKILRTIIKKSDINTPYIDIVKEYGNMVSASVPFALIKAAESNYIKRGDNILLLGTAAGLTINGLVIKY